MYLRMFGFTEKPFHLTPNPRFVYLSKNHREAFAHLLYGIQQRVGFLSLTGEVGTGKTTVLRTLLGQLDESHYRMALIFNPCLDSLGLLQVIHQELAIPFDPEGANLVRLYDSLNGFLLQQQEAGKTVVLVIDEAQNLNVAVLEQLRLLSNLETETEKLLQTVLVGQPELDQILERNDLRQLRQRLVVRYRLGAMDAIDTVAYVKHRLRIAGAKEVDIFSKTAHAKIYRFSRGTPRLVNILCDRALLVAYGRNSKLVNHRDVRIAQGELVSAPLFHREKYAALLVILCLFLMFGFFWAQFPPPIVDAQRNEVETLPVSAPVALEKKDSATLLVADSGVSPLQSSVAIYTSDSSFKGAFAALEKHWEKKPSSRMPAVRSVEDMTSILSSAGFRTLEMQARFEDIVRLDTPVVLGIIAPEVQGKRFFALTGVRGSAVRLEPALTASGWLAREELENIWFGQTFLPYENLLNLRFVGNPGESGEQVFVLQNLLRQAGIVEIRDTGVFDQQTIKAVKRFQAEHRLAPDGKVGKQTIFWLYKEAGLKMPRVVAGETS